MDQTCHRCGAALPAEPSFCGQCGAPQVRVPESLTIAAPAEGASGSSGEELLANPIAGNRLNRRHALKAAGIMGTLMTITAIVPRLSIVLPFWLVLGGWLTVTIYRRRVVPVPVSPKNGATLGALAGLLGFAFLSILLSAFLVIEMVILDHGEQIRATLRAQIEQAATVNPGPGAQALLELTKTPQGLATAMVFGLFVMLIVFLLFSCAGGTVAAFFGRSRVR